MNEEPYTVTKEICGCHYSIYFGNECIISSFDIINEEMANRICEQLNRAYRMGKREAEVVDSSIYVG